MPWSETSPMDERARFGARRVLRLLHDDRVVRAVRDQPEDRLQVDRAVPRWGGSGLRGWISGTSHASERHARGCGRADRPAAGKYPDAGPRTLLWHLEKLDPRRMGAQLIARTLDPFRRP